MTTEEIRTALEQAGFEFTGNETLEPTQGIKATLRFGSGGDEFDRRIEGTHFFIISPYYKDYEKVIQKAGFVVVAMMYSMHERWLFIKPKVSE